MRKLCAFKDFSKLISLNIESSNSSGGTKGNIYVTCTDLLKENVIFSKKYYQISGKVKMIMIIRPSAIC